jgi:DNA-binding transcriptional regulator YiaG
MTTETSTTTHRQALGGRAFWFTGASSGALACPPRWDPNAISPNAVVLPLIELYHAYLTVQTADAVGMQAASVGPMSGVLPASEPGFTAKAIRKAHEDSGLTWEQLARSFGVSRRSLHLWANGGRMNAGNVEILMSFADLVNHINAATPSERRAALLAINEDGRSILDSFRSHYLDRRGFANSEWRPEGYLNAVHGDVST